MEDTRVLMIDDDVKLCRLVKDYLEPFGFAVASAHTGPDGLKKAKEEKHDVLILDLMLPGLDGISLLRELRSFSSVPVIMLTALGDEPDRIVGLEVGADDYLPKTFSTRELLARLRAVVRRSRNYNGPSGADPKSEIRLGGLVIDPSRRSVTNDGEAIQLTALEFSILHRLAQSPGQVLDRNTLLDSAAGRDYDVFDRSIDVHISSLRKKLGDDSKNPRFIRTIRSVGYMLVPQSDEEAEK